MKKDDCNIKLIQTAKEVLKNAYAPYSGFCVGAAVLTDSDSVFSGCNIENASYGAANCAERTAIFKAVSEGECRIKKIAIVSSKGSETFPCGICRQVMAEFMEQDAIILLSDENGIYEYSLRELMPYSFSKDDLL